MKIGSCCKHHHEFKKKIYWASLSGLFTFKFFFYHELKLWEFLSIRKKIYGTEEYKITTQIIINRFYKHPYKQF